MKTAMQIAIEKLEECFDWDDTKSMLQELMQKEKEQIKDAYNIGFKVSKDLGAINPSIDIADDYYNQAHNQNK